MYTDFHFQSFFIEWKPTIYPQSSLLKSSVLCKWCIESYIASCPMAKQWWPPRQIAKMKGIYSAHDTLRCIELFLNLMKHKDIFYNILDMASVFNYVHCVLVVILYYFGTIYLPNDFPHCKIWLCRPRFSHWTFSFNQKLLCIL